MDIYKKRRILLIAVLAVLLVSLFTSCKSTGPITSSTAFPENCTILGRVTITTDSEKSGYLVLLEEAKKVNPKTKVTAKDIDGCIVVINGKQCKKSAKLSDGDEVWLMSPVCGG